MTNDARLAIIKYFSVVSGNENQAKKTQLASPLHPSLERAYRLLEPLFVEHVIGANGQGLLASSERWETLLKTLPETTEKYMMMANRASFVNSRACAEHRGVRIAS